MREKVRDAIATELRRNMTDWPRTVRAEAQTDATVRRWPDRVALIYRDRRWTYRQLRMEYDRRAAILIDAGVRPGTILATAEPPSDDLYLTFLACCRADVVFFPILPLYTTREVQDLIVRSKAGAIFTASGQPHPALPSLQALPLSLPGTPTIAAQNEAQRRSRTGSVESIAYIQTTSGTTGGTPKLASIPHRALTWQQADQARGRTSWWQEKYIVYQPSVNIFDRDLCETLGKGGTTVLADKNRVLRHEEAMTAHGITLFVPVPATLQVLAEQETPPPSGLHLHAVRTTAAPLSPTLLTKGERRYGTTVINEYASSEGGAMLATPHEGAPPGSIGRPYPGIGARIVNERGTSVPDGEIGELIVHTPCLMSGYLDDPLATAHALRDGWLYTGDLAWRDEQGNHFLKGRRALLINVGGFKVAPEEIESVLEQHPGVREAVVTGGLDRVRGEAIRAVIVPCGPKPPTVSDLRRFCRERLVGYKVPRHWEFRDRLPRGALGKVQRQAI